jgi:hypothetical protein
MVDLEAQPAPLHAMGSGGDHSKCPWRGAPTVMDDSHRPAEQGWMPLSVGQRHWSGGVLLCASACMGLLLVVTLVSAC